MLGKFSATKRKGLALWLSEGLGMPRAVDGTMQKNAKKGKVNDRIFCIVPLKKLWFGAAQISENNRAKSGKISRK